MIIDPLENPRAVAVPENPGFGLIYTNRMFTQHFTPEYGWHDARIQAFGPLPLHPVAQVLHIGLDIFEGTKAYRRPDGNLNLFRIERNMARMNRSASRLGMPQIDPDTHIGQIEALVRLEHEWVPRLPGCSLYIRPVIISTEETLEVRVGRKFLHYIFLSPVGPYFPTGFNPVSVYISHEYVRAARGGTGEAKTTANYAGTVHVAEQVRHLGYQQVLWLDAIERRYVEEVGAMNIMFVRDGKHIITPALSGSILHGITRESVLKLGPDLGYTVSEEKIDVDEMLDDIEKGRITEAFGVGTAAVVAPVGKFGYKGKEYRVNDERTGPVAQHLFTTLTDIQFGRAPDPYGWIRQIKVD